MNESQQPDTEEAGGWSLICPPTAEKLLPWLAALSSAGYVYRLEKYDRRWMIAVRSEDLPAVHGELGEYELVNRDWPPPERTVGSEQARELSSDSLAGAAPGIALLCSYPFLGNFRRGIYVFDRACADSERIMHGQWWRLVTSLCLHADLSHLLGNAASCLMLGFLLAGQVGYGLAWILIVATGLLGNLGAVFMGEPGKVAVGASTATFGILGVLSVLQFCRNRMRRPDHVGLWSGPWVPLAAGVGLLAYIGTGPKVDLAGHLAGFFSGVLLGGIVSPVLRHPLSNVRQFLLAAGAIILVGVSWSVAVR